MKESHRSAASLVAALVIILGSAYVGVWRSQRQDGAVAPAPRSVAAQPRPRAAVVPIDEQVDSESQELDDDDTGLIAEPGPPPQIPEQVSASAEELARWLQQMRIAVRERQLLEPADSSALAYATQILRVDPQNEDAAQVLARALAELRDVAEPVLPARLIDAAAAAVAASEQVGVEPSLLAAVANSLVRTQSMLDEVRRGEQLLAREGIGPRNLATATERFRTALTLDPANVQALKGLEEVQRRLIERAIAAAYDLRLTTAESLLAQADGVISGGSRVLDARSQIRAFRAQTEATELNRFKDSIAAGDLGNAEAAIEVLRRLSDDQKQLQEMASKVENVRLYGGFAVGERFSDALSDGGRGPRMVVLPVGSFTMGSPESEPGRSKNEGPQRQLRFERGFAMSRNEITLAEFRAFVEATQYVTDAEKTGTSAIYDERAGRMVRSRRVDWRRSFNGSRGRDNDPVVHVSWNDASAFASWLARASGKRYRLPTEAEFEYALRAGSTTSFPWGNGDPPGVIANLAGAGETSREGRKWAQGFPGYDDKHWGPAPVRTFEANAFRLHDMDGNVSEWVEDCWHDNYLRAPDSPIAWVNPGCELRVIRGGSWGSGREQVRSAWRGSAVANSSGARVGFRIVREL